MVALDVRVLPRTTFDLSAMTDGASSSTTIVRSMPTYAWISGALVVRVFEASLANGASVTLRIVTTAPAVDDPTNDFVAATFAKLTVDHLVSGGAALLAALPAPLPPFADLVVEQLVKPGTAAPFGAVTLSADVLVRGRYFDRVDPAAQPRRART